MDVKNVMESSDGVQVNNNDGWAGRVRSILQGLILLGVVYIASTVQSLNNATIRIQIQIENLQGEVSALQLAGAAVAPMQTDIGSLKAHQEEDERRLGALEQIRGHLQ